MESILSHPLDNTDTNPGSSDNILCRCNQRSRFNNMRKINDFMYIFTLFLIVISCTHTLCSASSSRRRPSANWNNNMDNIKDSDSGLSEYITDNVPDNDCQGDYLDGYSLSGGTKAGRYENIGTVTDISDCSKLCCLKDDCSLAIMLLYPKLNKMSCFNVHCYDEYNSERCKPIISDKSRFHPYIFKKHDIPKVIRMVAKTPSTVTTIDDANKNEKEKEGICKPYSGSVCADIIDTSKLYYYSTHNASTLDKRLQAPIEQLKDRLTEKCSKLALQAICYRFYPQCLDPLEPKPINICNDYCDKLINGDCATEFENAKMVSYLKRVIPGCDNPHNDVVTAGCIQLSDETTSEEGSNDESVSQEEIEKTIHERSEQSGGETDSLPDQKNEINDTPLNTSIAHNVSAQTSSPITTTSATPQNITTIPPTPSVTKPNSTKVIITTTPSTFTPKVTTIKQTTKTLVTTFIPLNVTNSSKPTFVDVKTEDTKETSLKVVSTVAASTPPPTLPVDHNIRVSAGDNTEITLPINHVSLFASTWPKEKEDGDYTYKWTQISSPAKSHGYIEGATSKNVKLTNLDVIGVYTFKLEVLLKKEKHGVGYVNITVKNPSRVNHPPRAEITQKDTVIQLPTNTVILDGSKSTDDDKIVSYQWEELKGPIKGKTFFASSTDSQILQLKNLVAGVYQFRLTVTDSNGETDSTEASVTVKKEPDYPPKANAGNDIVVRLPNNTVILNGNKSTDDKGSLKYQWSKTSDSPTCDMQGTDKSQLKLSRLQEGSYVFNLKVTDVSGQSDEAKVKVVVLPERNIAPSAIAGDDKEIIYPDDSTTLDGSKSNDNSKIVSFKWEQVSGPKQAKLTGVSDKRVHLSELVVGTYVLKLTVVDDKNLVGSDTVKVYVKKDHNEHPVAIAGKTITVYLPTRSVVLDGSKSHDDELIDEYLWTRAGLSPAAGVVVNGSDHKAILHLTNLVKGRYIFDLAVTDNKGLTGTDSVTVMVLENPTSLGLVELYLFLDIDNFSEENKKQLIRKLSVILEVGKEFVIVEEIAGATYGKGVMILFYVKDSTTERILDGKYVADMLKQKVGFGGKLFEYTMQRVEPYICRNNCSEHGYCDKSTKLCVCDSFWTANFLKARFGEKESNCDWSILYLSVAVFGLFLMLIGVAWAVCFCFARKKRNKRRARYRALRTTDPDTKEEILLIPKGMKAKFSANSLTFTESDEDSEQETTVFDKKKLVNGHVRMNGTANGSVSKYLEKDF